MWGGQDGPTHGVDPEGPAFSGTLSLNSLAYTVLASALLWREADEVWGHVAVDRGDQALDLSSLRCLTRRTPVGLWASGHMLGWAGAGG